MPTNFRLCLMLVLATLTSCLFDSKDVGEESSSGEGIPLSWLLDYPIYQYEPEKMIPTIPGVTSPYRIIFSSPKLLVTCHWYDSPDSLIENDIEQVYDNYKSTGEPTGCTNSSALAVANDHVTRAIVHVGKGEDDKVVVDTKWTVSLKDGDYSGVISKDYRRGGSSRLKNYDYYYSPSQNYFRMAGVFDEDSLVESSELRVLAGDSLEVLNSISLVSVSDSVLSSQYKSKYFTKGFSEVFRTDYYGEEVLSSILSTYNEAGYLVKQERVDGEFLVLERSCVQKLDANKNPVEIDCMIFDDKGINVRTLHIRKKWIYH